MHTEHDNDCGNSNGEDQPCQYQGSAEEYALKTSQLPLRDGHTAASRSSFRVGREANRGRECDHTLL